MNTIEELFSRGVASCIDPEGSFKKKIEAKIAGSYTGEIVIKIGVDPTRPDIHVGHAVNKILKDITGKYKTQQGFYAPFVPGYDGHGLPIENAVVKSVKGGRSALSVLELRERCQAFALKNMAGQTQQFKRLGVWGDWENPYITISGPFEAAQIEAFYQMYQKGYVYKGLKPVYWCASCETALADAEVEYADHQSPSIYADACKSW